MFTSHLALKTSVTKALGIFWVAARDLSSFSYSADGSITITRRRVLSELAQLFDLLGFLSPVIILEKKLID